MAYYWADEMYYNNMTDYRNTAYSGDIPSNSDLANTFGSRARKLTFASNFNDLKALNVYYSTPGSFYGELYQDDLDLTYFKAIKLYDLNIKGKISFSNQLHYLYNDNSTIYSNIFEINTTSNLNYIGSLNASGKTLVSITAPQLKLLDNSTSNFSKVYLKTKLLQSGNNNFFESPNLHLLINDLASGSEIKNFNINPNTEIINLNQNINWVEKGINAANIINATALYTNNGIKYALTNKVYNGDSQVKEAIIYDVDRDTLTQNVVNVPEEITVSGQRYKVVRVLSYAFAYLDNLKEITFPKTIATFGKGILKDNKALEKVTFKSTLANWDKEFITNSPNLKAINLPNGLSEIDLSQEYITNHQGLEHINIPKTKTYRVKNNAVINRITNEIILAAKNAKIEFGILGIGNSAFRGISVANLTLPDSLKTIGANAFRGSHLPQVLNLNYGLKKIGEYAFADIIEKLDLIIPETIEEIAPNAFANATDVTLKFRGNKPAWFTAPSNVNVEYNYQG